MNRFDCEQVRDRLDEWMAGRLASELARAMTDHVAECASCRLDAEASRAVAMALPGLPREVAPARELWAGIEQRLAGNTAPRWRRALGMAAAAVLVAAAGFWSLRNPGRAPSPPERLLVSSTAEAAAAELEAARLSDPGLPPEVRAALGRDLGIINDAIREARAQLRATPADPVAQALAESAVRKKLRLLRRAGDYTT